jgi:hypothetical protein
VVDTETLQDILLLHLVVLEVLAVVLSQATTTMLVVALETKVDILRPKVTMEEQHTTVALEAVALAVQEPHLTVEVELHLIHLGVQQHHLVKILVELIGLQVVVEAIKIILVETAAAVLVLRTALLTLVVVEVGDSQKEAHHSQQVQVVLG